MHASGKAALAAGKAVALVTPNQNDFLIGKDNMCFKNRGNQYMKELVMFHYEEYQAADAKADYEDVGKRSKGVIAREIVAKVKQNGGRFLRRCVYKDKSSPWCEVPDREATTVIVGGFRNHKRNLKKRRTQPASSGPMDAKSTLKHPPRGTSGTRATGGRAVAIGMENDLNMEVEVPFLLKDASVDGGDFDHSDSNYARGQTSRSASASIPSDEVEPIDNFDEPGREEELGELLAIENVGLGGVDWLFRDDDHANELGDSPLSRGAMPLIREKETMEDAKQPAKASGTFDENQDNDCRERGPVEVMSMASRKADSATPIRFNNRASLQESETRLHSPIPLYAPVPDIQQDMATKIAEARRERISKLSAMDLEVARVMIDMKRKA